MIYTSCPRAGYLKYQEEIDESIRSVLNSDRYIKGESVTHFEKNISKYIGVKYSIGVGNATDAIFLSLRALKIGIGDEVITVSHTATGTVAAIVNTGAIPVFVDIDKDYYTIDPGEIEEGITKRTKAIIVVHIYGQACEMDEILAISNKYGLPIIEDCAQATGGEYKGNKLGSLGVVGCFSFFPTKNLSCIGDGGLVTTNDRELCNKIKSLGEYGWDKKREAISIGINSRLDELQAAVLNVKLRYLDVDNEDRRNIAERYRARIKNPLVRPPTEAAHQYHVYYLYVLNIGRQRDRDDLIRYLQSHGISPAIHYPIPVHKQKAYKKFVRSRLKNTEEVVNHIISIPIYQGMEATHIDTTIHLLNNFQSN